MRVLFFTKDIPTAGARVQISNTEDDVKVIYFKARAGNAGNTYVGEDDVASTKGHEMLPDGTAKISFGDGSVKLSTFYVDAATNGDDVDVTVIVNP